MDFWCFQWPILFLQWRSDGTHASLIIKILLDHLTETTKTPWYRLNIAQLPLKNVRSLIINNVVNSCPLIALLNYIFYYIIKHAHKTTYTCSYNCVQKYMARYINGSGYPKNCESYARIHNGGPRGCTNPNTMGYWNKIVSNCCTPDS